MCCGGGVGGFNMLAADQAELARVFATSQRFVDLCRELSRSSSGLDDGISGGRSKSLGAGPNVSLQPFRERADSPRHAGGDCLVRLRAKEPLAKPRRLNAMVGQLRSRPKHDRLATPVVLDSLRAGAD